MADNNVVFSRSLLKKFILLYKDLPCLWDRECAAYKIKMKRHDAITKLTELVQEFDPSATRVHVLRKIESLRACVRREFKRVQDSRRKASSDDEIYAPHLWYYDLFSFIFRNEESEYKLKETGSPEHTAISDGHVVIESLLQGSEEEEDDGHQFETGVDYVDFKDFSVSNNMVEVDEASSVSKRYLSFDEEQGPSKMKRHFTEVEDEYDAIGINVAAKLRYLPPTMRVLAEKLINDVLFQAQINGLTSSTVIATPDPFKQDSNCEGRT